MDKFLTIPTDLPSGVSDGQHIPTKNYVIYAEGLICRLNLWVLIHVLNFTYCAHIC